MAHFSLWFMTVYVSLGIGWWICFHLFQCSLSCPHLSLILSLNPYHPPFSLVVSRSRSPSLPLSLCGVIYRPVTLPLSCFRWWSSPTVLLIQINIIYPYLGDTCYEKCITNMHRVLPKWSDLGAAVYAPFQRLHVAFKVGLPQRKHFLFQWMTSL